MRLRSFRYRLILGAVVWIVLGVVVSGIVLSSLFRDHVREQFDWELNDHAAELEILLGRDQQGRLFLRQELSDPRFQPTDSGYYWQIQGPRGEIIRSSSLRDFTLPLPSESSGDASERELMIDGPTGPLIVLLRRTRLDGAGEPVTIAMGSDKRYLDAALLSFERTLAISLGVIALGLMAAAYTQIRYGLQPLDRLRKAIRAVRSGQSRRLPEDLPLEVNPLVTELNSLMDANEAIAQQGRIEAGNLAHALKNPLAILMDEGARLVASGQAEPGHLLLQQCGRMRRHIDYHLARARAAASRSGPGVATRFGPALRAVIAALARLHQGRGVAFEVEEIPDDAMLACDVEDLNEMLGNLVDNAAKWARTRVRVSARTKEGSTLIVRIEDDGPGMPVEAREIVFKAGERLDEQTPGSGLGLAIVRGLATRCGGRAWIEESDMGGAAACLELPLIRTT